MLDELVTVLVPDAFATAALFVCESDGHVTYARAGHPFPLLAGLTGLVDVLGDGGRPALGAGPAPVTDGTFEMAPGSALVLYTDGLVEEPGVDIGVGIMRLIDVLREGGDDRGVVLPGGARRVPRAPHRPRRHLPRGDASRSAHRCLGGRRDAGGPQSAFRRQPGEHRRVAYRAAFAVVVEVGVDVVVGRRTTSATRSAQWASTTRP